MPAARGPFCRNQYFSRLSGIFRGNNFFQVLAPLSVYVMSLPPGLFPNFHCSFYIFLCSLLLFNFSSCSLIISLAPCSIFPIFCCSLLPFPNFSAPCSQITFSLLPAPFLILGHAPCSLGSQGPFSLIPDYPQRGFLSGKAEGSDTCYQL